MNILVCVSSVPDTTSKISFDTDGSSLNTQGVQYVMNPIDELAVNKAMEIKEANQAEITLAHVGNSDSEPIIRKALAIGIDKAIRVDSKPHEGTFVAKQLTAIAQESHYDLILMGRESIDYNSEVVHAMTAAYLDYPFINHCIDLKINENQIQLVRETENTTEEMTVNSPVVIAVQKGIVDEKKLRIPNMRGIMVARQKPIDTKPPVSNDVSYQNVSFETHKKSGEVKIIDVDALAALLEKELKSV